MKLKTIINLVIVLALSIAANTSFAKPDKPNILVIWGDDIGPFIFTVVGLFGECIIFDVVVIT